MKIKNLFLVFSTYYIALCSVGEVDAKKIEDSNNEDFGNAPDENEITPPKKNERLRPPSCGVTVKPCDPNSKFRRFDGSCNNLNHPEWGLPNSTYSRLLPPKYHDGIKSPRRASDSTPLPGARRIRTSLFPAGSVPNTLWTVNIMLWGQFVAHDMSLMKHPDKDIACCPKRGDYETPGSKYCFPIKISKDDPTQGQAGIKCIDFIRTITDRDMGCKKKNLPASQINVVTSYLDLSNVYGNDEFTANSLRSFVGGRFKVETRNNRVYPPTEPNKNAFCKCNLPNENTCYATGDSRSNQNPQLAIQQILYVREHNRLADALASLNPNWNDERLFQEARRINIAEYQHITYNEWLPILLKRLNLTDAGVIFPLATGFVNDYDPSVSPDISNEHAHAAYRHFHTQIVSILHLMSAQRTTLSDINMEEWVNRQGILEVGTSMEQLTIGMLTQATGETDVQIDETMSDKLFSCRNEGFGIDLKAADIQRDRDHALAYYNDYRRLFGLKVATSFDDYTDFILPENVEKLKQLYTSHEDVDLSVGGSLEVVTRTGVQVGPTFMKILLDQFKRTRQSDRFWFENESSGLTLDQLLEIKKATVSRLFCDNADGVTEIQPRGFNLIRGTNLVVPCSTLNVVDLTKWKE